MTEDDLNVPGIALHTGTRYCSQCGRQLVDVFKACDSCQRLVPAHWTQCWNCGRDVGGIQAFIFERNSFEKNLKFISHVTMGDLGRFVGYGVTALLLFGVIGLAGGWGVGLIEPEAGFSKLVLVGIVLATTAWISWEDFDKNRAERVFRSWFPHTKGGLLLQNALVALGLIAWQYGSMGLASVLLWAVLTACVILGALSEVGRRRYFERMEQIVSTD